MAPAGAGKQGGNAQEKESPVVIVRVRPFLPRELQYDNAVEIVSESEIVAFKPNAEFASVYHRVFGERSTQEELYGQVQGSVLSALQGYNATIFAYGQTGTGKTHTMLGPPTLDLSSASAAAAAGDAAAQGGGGAAVAGGGPQWSTMGLIPRALADLFNEARLLQKQQGARIQVVCSYMEIYNDRLYDLLQPYKKGHGNRDPADMDKRKAILEVREDKGGNTYVPNLLCVKVSSYSSVLSLLAKGNRNRAVRHTEMNVTSSRSHAILQLVIEQWPPAAMGGKAGTVLRSKLNFVDLAGSERWNKEVDMATDRVNEMNSINGSLSALASVVAALTAGAARKHVPYRDSRLTHLLQDSLGGNCRTTIIATVSPSVDAFEETVSTLKFADRASAIGNNPVVNTSRDLNSVLALKEREISRLRQMLAAYMQSGSPASPGGAAGGEEGSAGGGVQGGVGDGSASGGGGSLDADQLMSELESLRRALEMERALRSELEAKLQQAGVTSGLAGLAALGGDGSIPSTVASPARGRFNGLGEPRTPGGQDMVLVGGLSDAGGPPSSSGMSHAAATPLLSPPSAAGRGAGGSRGEVNYLRISSPPPLLEAEPSMGGASQLGGSTASTLRGSAADPFAAVLARRAQLGLGSPASPAQAAAAAAGGPRQPQGYPGMRSPRSQGGLPPSRRSVGYPVSSSNSRHGSPPRRSASALPQRPSAAWAPSSGGAGGGSSRSQSSSPARRPAGGAAAGGSGTALEDALRSIREQVMQLTVLENQNRQRMAALAAASHANRASASPARKRPAGSKGGPRSVYGAPGGNALVGPYAQGGPGGPLRKAASSGARVGGGASGAAAVAGSPARKPGSASPVLTTAAPPGGQQLPPLQQQGALFAQNSEDTFSRLLAAAHASVTPTPLQVALGPGGQNQQELSATATLGAWGRSAVAQGGPGSTAPQTTGGSTGRVTYESGSGAGSSQSQAEGAAAAGLAPTPSWAPAGSRSWGRSALLLGGTPASQQAAPQTPAQVEEAGLQAQQQQQGYAGSPSTAISAPASGAGGWGRSSLLGTMMQAQQQQQLLHQAQQQQLQPQQQPATPIFFPLPNQGGGALKATGAPHSSQGGVGSAYASPTKSGIAGGAGGGLSGQPSARSVSNGGAHIAQHRPNNSIPASPGRLDKGSLIYILGPSASSIKAKAMASALQHQQWG